MRQLTQQYVQELFEYKDGKLYWKVNRGNHALANKRAGSVHKKTGYRRVTFDRRPHLEHRIIFLYNYGYVPECLDHIDGNRENNNLDNLRPATWEQNVHNRKAGTNNTSGVKGVNFHAARDCWVAKIRKKQKLVFCKYYKTIEEAEIAIRNARNILHKEFARHE